MAPLSGFDQTRCVKVFFSVLTAEIVDGVPVEFTATPETRINLYRQITDAYETAQRTNADASVVDFHVPWNMLDFPKKYGRTKKCDLNHVAKIVNNFADHKYAVPRVVMMPIYNKRNELVDVKFWVSDGWHRRTVKIEIIYRDDPASLSPENEPATIQCSITPVKTIQEAAQCFAAQNSPKERRTMDKADNWRARVVAGEPGVMAVVNMARKHGFNAESPSDKYKNWPYFTSGDILLRMMFEFSDVGEDVVDRALSLLSDEKNIGVYGKKKALDANFFGGLCLFIAIFERPGFAHALGIEYMLQQEGIIDKIKDITDSMSQEDQRRELPEKFFGGWSREENKRYLSRAAAFSVLYSRYVPVPNSRTGFWSKCPSALRKLRHVAATIEDIVDRDSYIAKLQGQLASRGHDAAWPKYELCVD